MGALNTATPYRKKYCQTPHHCKKSRWNIVTAIYSFSHSSLGISGTSLLSFTIEKKHLVKYKHFEISLLFVARANYHTRNHRCSLRQITHLRVISYNQTNDAIYQSALVRLPKCVGRWKKLKYSYLSPFYVTRSEELSIGQLQSLLSR